MSHVFFISCTVPGVIPNVTSLAKCYVGTVDNTGKFQALALANLNGGHVIGRKTRLVTEPYNEIRRNANSHSPVCFAANMSWRNKRIQQLANYWPGEPGRVRSQLNMALIDRERGVLFSLSVCCNCVNKAVFTLSMLCTKQRLLAGRAGRFARYQKRPRGRR